MTAPKNDPLETARVTWALSDLYRNPDDPELSGEMEKCRKEAGVIRGRYEGKVKALSAGELNKLVNSLETLEARLGKIATFAQLNFATRTRDAEAGALLQKVREFLSDIGRETVFFELEWNRMDDESAKPLLQSPELDSYRHYLTAMRRYAPHQLSTIEEALLIEKAPTGRSSWNNLFDKVMGHLTFGAEGRSEEEVLTDLYSPARETRKQAADDLTAGLKSQLHVLTHIFNTILADKMINDRLRHYPSWVESMNLQNEIEGDTVELLVQEVTGRYDIVKRYYRLKSEILGADQLFDYDRYAPLPNLPDRRITWSKCREMVIESFNRFSPEMGRTALMFFEKSWIHAPVMEGKRGGAFAHPCVPGVHPYIMVNYNGTLRDVSTVAHELGHGVHQYLAARQGYYQSGTPLVLAETASVFAELLLFKAQMDSIDAPEQRRAFICQKLESIFATVFRQVAMNRFEDRIHNARRHQGELSARELTSHWLATQNEMFGDSVTLRDDYGIWWSYIPHFLSSPGYVYSYAFGELLVLSLYHLYQEEPDQFVPLYLELLASGGNASPGELLKPFGVNLEDPGFWKKGLEIIDGMLKEIE